MSEWMWYAESSAVAPSGTSFIVAVVGLLRSPTARQRSALTTALKNVDLPTEGLPTRPIL
jgi:hypothetical protein